MALSFFRRQLAKFPGLSGRLNPKLDSHGRAYLYASNISINQGQQQPVPFILGEELRLTDSNGIEMTVRIVDIVGRSALVRVQTMSLIQGK